MNVDSSSSMNGDDMMCILFLPSVNVGRPSAMNVSVFFNFLLYSMNVDSLSSVNGGDMIYFLFLPTVNVGSTSAVNVGVCYLFAIFSEC